MTLCGLDLFKLWRRRPVPDQIPLTPYWRDFRFKSSLLGDDGGARVWAPYSAMPELFDIVQQEHSPERRRWWMTVLHTHEVFDRSLGALLARVEDLHRKSGDYNDVALDMLSHRTLRLRAKLREYAETDAEFRALLRPETLFMQPLSSVVEERYAIDTDPAPLLYDPPMGVFKYTARTLGNLLLKVARHQALDDDNFYFCKAKEAMATLAACAEIILHVWQFPRCTGFTDARLEKAIEDMVAHKTAFYTRLDWNTCVTALYFDIEKMNWGVISMQHVDNFIPYNFS